MPGSSASPARTVLARLARKHGGAAEPRQRRLLAVVVDDDPDTPVPASLRSAGYDVRLAADGITGLDLAATLSPSVVVVDLTLPGLDGWELIRLLRRDAATADLPIVVLSGHTDPALVAEAWAAGCDAYLTKPCAPEGLLTGIERARARGAGPA